VTKRAYFDYDMKIAVSFINSADNTVVNHTKILDFASSLFYELLGDGSDGYLQPMDACRPDYFQDAINPVTLTDCFVVPKNVIYNIIPGTSATGLLSSLLQYSLTPLDDDNPFSSKYGSALAGYQLQL
jgi:hypothetical protein